MRSAIILSAFAALAAAVPNYYPPAPVCISDSEAKALVKNVIALYTSNDPKELAIKYLTPDFQLYTDSVAIIFPELNKPLGTPFASSRKELIKQNTGFNPDNPGYKLLAYYHTCDTVIFRWEGKRPIPVRGIDVLEVVHTPSGWKVKTNYSEFNNIALLANFGVCPGGPCPDPQATSAE